MLKVILADDERKVVLLLQKMIDWGRMGYEIVGVANDGIQALRLIERQQPDLLITDIRMPGCDGIDLIRRARELVPSIHFIIISGYTQFEYARSALKYGVEDYLLKPLKKDELDSILLRVREKLGEEAELEYRLEKSREKRQEMLLEELEKCADGQQPFASARQINEEYGFRFADGQYCTVIVKPDISDAGKQEDSYQLLLRHSLDIVRSEIEGIADEFAAAIFEEGIVVLMNSKEFPSIELKQCFTKIRREIEKQRDLFCDVSVTVCIGGRFGEMERMTQSLTDALWLCKDRICRRNKGYYDIEDGLGMAQPSTGVLWQGRQNSAVEDTKRYQMNSVRRKRFREAAEYLRAEQFERELTESYYELIQDKQLNGQMIDDWLGEVVRACLFGMEAGRAEEEQLFHRMYVGFWRCTQAQQVYQMVMHSIGEMIRQRTEEKAEQEAKPITDAKRYIQKHYREALRLEDVSNAIGFNATYFSTLFKKETGMNFSDYLTELRINKAKELLCQEDIMIIDAAEMVGYKDLKYFSRLFKKTTGISPSDYKKLYR